MIGFENIIVEGNKMANTKILSLFLILFFTIGLLLFASPNNSQAQHQVMGCCQFEGDEPGCWYPADPGPCANLEGKYLEGEKCDADTGYCSGYNKDGSESSDSGK